MLWIAPLKIKAPAPKPGADYYIFKSNFSSASLDTHTVELLIKLTYHFLTVEEKNSGF